MSSSIIDSFDFLQPPKSEPIKREPPTFKPHAKFTPDEDKRLLQLVSQYGSKAWVIIARFMPKRNSRQCRERYLNYLSPFINKGDWSEKEDELLLIKYQEFGSKWVTIASFFPDRTDAMVKNRFQVLLRRSLKKIRKQAKLEKKTKANKPKIVRKTHDEEDKIKNEEDLSMTTDIFDTIEYDIFGDCYQIQDLADDFFS